MRPNLSAAFLILLLSLGAGPLLAQTAASANPKNKGENKIITEPLFFDVDYGPGEGSRLENGFLSLDFATEPGTLYRVIYLVGTTGGPAAGMRIDILSSLPLSLGSAEIHLPGPDAAWAPVGEFDFQATTTTSTLRLVDISPGGASGSGLVYEDVVVTAIPEPGVTALLALALLGLGLRGALGRRLGSLARNHALAKASSAPAAGQ